MLSDFSKIFVGWFRIFSRIFSKDDYRLCDSRIPSCDSKVLRESSLDIDWLVNLTHTSRVDSAIFSLSATYPTWDSIKDISCQKSIWCETLFFFFGSRFLVDSLIDILKGNTFDPETWLDYLTKKVQRENTPNIDDDIMMAYTMRHQQ